MNLSSDLDVLKLFAHCNTELNARNLQIVQTTDFRHAEDRAIDMGKGSVTPMLSADHNDLSKDDAFWLFLQEDGKDIGCVAARRDNLHSESLSEYWTRSYRRYYGVSEQAQSHTHAPAVIKDIRGSVVYLGEFFISKSSRGSRHRLALFTHALHAYCFAKWRPNWLYAFIRQDDVRKGYGAEYGFVHQVPAAQAWSNPPGGRKNGEYLAVISQPDLLHMATAYCRNPELLVSVDSLTSVEKFNM